MERVTIGSWYESTPFMRPSGRPGVSAVLEERLLVGEYPTPEDAEWLRETHGVTAVVCLQDDADLASKNLDLRALARAYERAGIAFHHVPVADGDVRDLAARLPDILARLHALVAAGERVYLHCNAGFNRAPTVAIAYVHHHRGLPLQDAWELVKQRRSCAPYRRALELHFSEETSS
ncbi:MAG TPA: dual specificity protein phosphatase family protein [Candidatus Binatia bacterium]|nr:dual specificity protein phosphatase family protein [Candidatus Binatia bacterium]